MTQNKVLSQEELQSALRKLPGWRVENGKLCRDLKFATFVEAFGFLSSLALVAERMDHHPEIFNVYGTVNLALWTHDSNGITGLDVALAESANALARI
jgi:4a-hydroxytetrahydrobiopterin dehydratase